MAHTNHELESKGIKRLSQYFAYKNPTNFFTNELSASIIRSNEQTALRFIIEALEKSPADSFLACGGIATGNCHKAALLQFT